MIKELEEKINELEVREKDLILLEIEKKKIIEEYKAKIEPYDRVQLARHEKRPKTKDFIENIIKEGFLCLMGSEQYPRMLKKEWMAPEKKGKV